MHGQLTTSIYNSRNYITLLGKYEYCTMQQIYNSRNYITLLGLKETIINDAIYNSRNYITLLGVQCHRKKGKDLQ